MTNAKLAGIIRTRLETLGRDLGGGEVGVVLRAEAKAIEKVILECQTAPLSAQVEGQTDEEIAKELWDEIFRRFVDAPGVNGDDGVRLILAALRAKSEKPQSSGKKDAPSDDVEAVLQNALEPFARMASKFDVEPYAKDYPDNLILRDNAIVLKHAFLTIGDCRRAKAALKLLLSSQGGGSPATSVPAKPTPVPSESEKDTERTEKALWLLAKHIPILRDAVNLLIAEYGYVRQVRFVDGVTHKLAAILSNLPAMESEKEKKG